MKTGSPSAAPRAVASSRSRLLADTPPAMPDRRAPRARAPRRTGDRAASRRPRAESWRTGPPRRAAAADRRATRPSSARRCCRCRTTDVLSPLKLKSLRPGRCGALRSACVSRVRGSGTARSLPCAARRSMTGPPGIAEAEEPRHLVVGLAGRVVARAAQALEDARRAARDTGWCARPTPPARRRAAASRRLRAPATRCGPPGGAPEPAARREPTPAPWRSSDPTSSDPTRPGPCVTAIAS